MKNEEHIQKDDTDKLMDEKQEIMRRSIEKARILDPAAKLARMEAALKREGFSDLEEMITKYKTTMLVANEADIEKDETNERLRAELAEQNSRITRTETGKCKFCEQYDFIKQMHSDTEKRNPELQHKIFVAIVDRARKKGELEYRGGITYEKHQLRYCPECGKKLTETRRDTNETQRD